MLNANDKELGLFKNEIVLQDVGWDEEEMSWPLIALIAHDNQKEEIIGFATFNHDYLAKYRLIATASTGESLRRNVGLKVLTVLSGPEGGDAQISALVAAKQVSAVIFFVDPRTAHPHEPDIATLQRICNIHNVPLATNRSAANLFMAGLPHIKPDIK